MNLGEMQVRNGSEGGVYPPGKMTIESPKSSSTPNRKVKE